MSSTPRRSDDWEPVLSEASREAVEAVLEPAESVDFVAPAVGSSLVLTERRLIVVRDGANFRPKSGVRSFKLESGLAIRVGPRRRHLIVESAGHAITLFLRSDQLAQAEAFVAEVRRRMYSGD